MRTTVLLKNIKRTVLLLASVSLLLGLFCGCENKKDRAARDAKEQDAAQRQAEQTKKVSDLTASATEAMGEQKYDEAKASIKELLEIDPGNADAKKLNEEIEAAGIMAELEPLRSSAIGVLSSVQDIDRANGMGEAADKAKAVLDAAHALYEQKKYEEAVPKYEEAFEKGTAVREAVALRYKALMARSGADTAKDAAGSAKAPVDAKDLWVLAIVEVTAADAAFESADFETARDSYAKAAEEFDASKLWAEGAQSVASVKADYNDLIAANSNVKLDQFGGELWDGIKELVADADELAAGGQWDDADLKVNEAIDGLGAAIAAAQKGEEAKIRRQNYLKALASFGNELSKAKEQLDIARNTPKTKPGGKYYTDQGLDILKKCEGAEWYKLLGKIEHRKLSSVRKSLQIERFYFKCPDLLAVHDAKFAAIGRLADGSAEARIEQKKASLALEAPFEVKTRKTGIRFRLIPTGKFMMGTPSGVPKTGSDEREHEVVITRPFYMGKYEVTQSQWRQLELRANSVFKDSNADLPAESMLWKTAVDFCERLCEEEGVPVGTYRLATEAEWEYACRAGTTTFFSSGKEHGNLNYAGWYEKNSEKKTHGVGEKVSNAWGLYDMHGNVWEWCVEAPRVYGDDLVSDPSNTDKNDPHRALRGGGWNDAYRACRSANRGSAKHKDISSYDIGLRVIRLAPAE